MDGPQPVRGTISNKEATIGGSELGQAQYDSAKEAYDADTQECRDADGNLSPTGDGYLQWDGQGYDG